MADAELRTERLRLTRPCLADAAGVLEILGDPRTVEHNPSDGLGDLDAAAALVARWIDRWDEHGFGYWCVRAAGSPRLIGYAGVKRMVIHDRPVLNLVYRFVPDAWGRGLATEAAAAVVAKALADLPTETVVARVRPDNEPSQRVARKIGLRREPALDCEGQDGLDRVFVSSRME